MILAGNILRCVITNELPHLLNKIGNMLVMIIAYYELIIILS